MTATAGRTSLSAETYQDPDYMRFDVIGLNYRMSKIQAIMGIAQLERLPHIIAQRRAVARMFFDATNSPSDFDPPWGTHSYYTFPVSYDGNWKEFYNKFKSMGGDGFYAAPQVAYNEPALNEYRGDCPIAEDIQKKLMLFKTNYRNLGEAEIHCRLLNSLIFPAKPQLSLVERAFSVNATVKSSKNLAENPSQPI